MKPEEIRRQADHFRSRAAELQVSAADMMDNERKTTMLELIAGYEGRAKALDDLLGCRVIDLPTA